MPPTTIHTAPSIDSFTSLADHQSQTPSSFFGAKPVLHYYLKGARAAIARGQVGRLPIFGDGVNGGVNGDGNGGVNGSANEVVQTVDIFVNSANLTLFNPTRQIGIEIPYPSISLHAIQRVPDPSDPSKEIQSLYMQLELVDVDDPAGGGADADGDEEMSDVVELTLTAPESSSLSSSSDTPHNPTTTTDSTTDPNASPITHLFTAISSCSNLHPDPINKDLDDDDQYLDEDSSITDHRLAFSGSSSSSAFAQPAIGGLPGVWQGAADGGLPPPFPGSGGWITAENVGEFFDADGQWIGGSGEGDGEEGEEIGEEGGNGEGEVQEGLGLLGRGAGRVRGRDEVDASENREEEGEGVNGHGHVNGDGEGEAAKRARIE